MAGSRPKRTPRSFLSTPSARRATPRRDHLLPARKNFYPRPPRGGRPALIRFGFPFTANFYPRPPRGGRPSQAPRPRPGQDISIHALREEGDERVDYEMDKVIQFLSTPSARRATQEPHGQVEQPMDFYPRPPRGGRQLAPGASIMARLFLSTPSARRATCRAVRDHEHQRAISIHALREEGDEKPPRDGTCGATFLSTPSARRATPEAPA